MGQEGDQETFLFWPPLGMWDLVGNEPMSPAVKAGEYIFNIYNKEVRGGPLTSRLPRKPPLFSWADPPMLKSCVCKQEK